MLQQINYEIPHGKKDKKVPYSKSIAKDSLLSNTLPTASKQKTESAHPGSRTAARHDG
jgi:hypothetical protein